MNLIAMRHYEGTDKVKKELKVECGCNGNYLVKGLHPKHEITNNDAGEIIVVDIGGPMVAPDLKVRSNNLFIPTIDKRFVLYEIKVGDMIKEVKAITPIGNIYGHAWIVKEIKDGVAMGQLDYEYNEMSLKSAVSIPGYYGFPTQWPKKV